MVTFTDERCQLQSYEAYYTGRCQRWNQTRKKNCTLLLSTVQHVAVAPPPPHLACEDFGRMFDHSFLACAFVAVVVVVVVVVFK